MLSQARKKTKSVLAACFLLLPGLFCYKLVLAHGEKIEIANKPGGPVYLSQAQAKMIDLKMARASPRPLTQFLGLNGELQLLPDAQADVSVRVSGHVTALYANLGDQVKAGQPLVKVQSLLIGDPPPSVVINSPMTGVIDARNISLGQAVQPNTVLFHISNRSQLIVLAKVYEEDLGKVKPGQKAKIQVLSYPQQSFLGKVILIEPNLDSLTRTVNVQILLDNRQDLLKPGMFARAHLILKESQSVLAVPNAAILEANDEKFVFRQQGEHYQRVRVQTGIRDDSYTQITKGLATGDQIAIQGNRQLYTLWLTGGSSPHQEEDEH